MHALSTTLNTKSMVKPNTLVFFVNQLLSDFINLTQVHNFTVSAQDIFTFRRLSYLP